MKQPTLLIALLSLVILSCNKQNSVDELSAPKDLSASLAGSWRMIAVKDNNSGLIITKPDLIQKDVDITFSKTNSNAGSFYGNTPTNDISQSDYITGTDQQLKIPFLAMTKVQETSWGDEFVANIRAAHHYNFSENGNLCIKTLNKTLTFQKQ